MTQAHTNTSPEISPDNPLEDGTLSKEALDRLAILTDAQHKLYDLQAQIEKAAA